MKNEFLEEYASSLRKEAKFRRPMRIVFDCSNGHVGLVIKEVLKGTKNIEAFYMNAKPDGDFPGHGPDPSKSEAMASLAREVTDRKADLGVIFDGDADRVVFVDDEGREIDSDDLINFYCENKRTKSIVVDLRVGWAVRERRGINIVRTKVGNYFIKRAMIENRIDLGAERTGHYYFKIKGGYIDDPLRMALAIISFISKTGAISLWVDEHKKTYRMKEENISVNDKEAAIKALKKAYARRKPQISDTDGLTMEFRDFWFNIRPSANENLLRINMEARTTRVLQKELEVLKSLIKTR
jgi:phosphomannomutase